MQTIDQYYRRISFKGPLGNTTMCRVDERVRNLPLLKEGDRVAVTYIDAAAVRVIRNAQGGEDVVIERRPSERQDGEFLQEVSTTAEVVGLDRHSGAVLVRGADGEATRITFQNAEKVAGLELGDRLWITYTEGLALSLQLMAREAH